MGEEKIKDKSQKKKKMKERRKCHQIQFLRFITQHCNPCDLLVVKGVLLLKLN